jgi:DNA-binding transcriptional ArsR family regulator
MHKQLAGLAALLADETRAAFCLALLDGRAWTAGELARHAGVAPSTATEHLNRLIEGGLLVGERQGRHRYVRLANDRVATLIEDLSSHEAPSARPATLRQSTKNAALARGRTCYDHLAGQLGVAVTDTMTRAGYLDQRHGFALTDTGLRWLTGPLGVDPATLRTARRPLARPCLDWTERRPHLGGLAGARLCERALQQRWVERIGTGRAVRITKAGERALLTA